MSVIPVQTSSSFPQTSTNRTRLEALTELASYVGGENDPKQRARVGLMWDAARREYNGVCWKFNLREDDITLTISTQEYELNDDFYKPKRVQLLDSNSVEVQRIRFIEYDSWVDWLSIQQRSGGPVPLNYTVRNAHTDGLIAVWPKSGTTLSHPTMRVHYFIRIAKAQNDDTKLNVPEEVDEAIFQLAVYKVLSRGRSFVQSRDARAAAFDMRLEIEQTWRDYPDY